MSKPDFIRRGRPTPKDTKATLAVALLPTTMAHARKTGSLHF